MMNKKKTFAIGGVIAASLLLTAGGCDGPSQADKASENTSTAADNFEVQRKIVGINTRTDKYLFYVEGRCSIDRNNGDLIVTCKQGPDQYMKHYIGGATDVAWVATQLAPIDVSVYKTRVILKPEGLIPEVELSVGVQ